MGILRWVVIAALLAWGQVVDAFTGDGAASVTEPARRDVQIAVDATCDLTTVTALSGRHPDVRQFVVMATGAFADTDGTVDVAVRDEAGEWRCQTSPLAAVFGRSGTRPLIDRRSGDGTTPAGVFPLGEVTAWDGQVFSMFGNDPDPGVVAPYRDVRPEDCWGATPGSPRYQHLVDLPGCSSPDEWLTRIAGVYAYAAVIGANLEPVSGDEAGEPPYAAAIFLHRHNYTDNAREQGAIKRTSGCVSLERTALVTVLRLLDPRLDPHFAIGPRDWLRTTA